MKELYLFVGVSKYLKVSPKFYPLLVAVRYVPYRSAEAKRSLGTSTIDDINREL